MRNEFSVSTGIPGLDKINKGFTGHLHEVFLYISHVEHKLFAVCNRVIVKCKRFIQNYVFIT